MQSSTTPPGKLNTKHSLSLKYKPTDSCTRFKNCRKYKLMVESATTKLSIKYSAVNSFRTLQEKQTLEANR